MLNQVDITLLSNKLPFFSNLSLSQRNLLINNTNEIHYKKGQSIHNGDCDCIGVLLIKKGSIRIYITSEEGREVTLFRLEDGDLCILSASCILHDIDFDVSIDADTDCEVLQISSPAFSKLSSDNVYVELFTYKLATERFSDVMWAMQQMLFKSFDKRLASFLFDECVKNGNDKINMTHEQIAKYLGSAREVVSRMLKYFSSENIVSLSRGGITVIDKKKLKDMIN